MTSTPICRPMLTHTAPHRVERGGWRAITRWIFVLAVVAIVSDFEGRHRLYPLMNQPDLSPDSLPESLDGVGVILVGLKSATHLNARRGHVQRFDPKQGRYIVELDGNKQKLLVRRTNLRVMTLSANHTTPRPRNKTKVKLNPDCKYSCWCRLMDDPDHKTKFRHTCYYVHGGNELVAPGTRMPKDDCKDLSEEHLALYSHYGDPMDQDIESDAEFDSEKIYKAVSSRQDWHFQSFERVAPKDVRENIYDELFLTKKKIDNMREDLLKVWNLEEKRFGWTTQPFEDRLRRLWARGAAARQNEESLAMRDASKIQWGATKYKEEGALKNAILAVKSYAWEFIAQSMPRLEESPNPRNRTTGAEIRALLSMLSDHVWTLVGPELDHPKLTGPSPDGVLEVINSVRMGTCNQNLGSKFPDATQLDDQTELPKVLRTLLLSRFCQVFMKLVVADSEGETDLKPCHYCGSAQKKE
ncbi:hypothetical protein AAMO2058_000438100 [Amorphochlora amoebiformis]